MRLRSDFLSRSISESKRIVTVFLWATMSATSVAPKSNLGRASLRSRTEAAAFPKESLIFACTIRANSPRSRRKRALISIQGRTSSMRARASSRVYPCVATIHAATNDGERERPAMPVHQNVVVALLCASQRRLQCCDQRRKPLEQ